MRASAHAGDIDRASGLHCPENLYRLCLVAVNALSTLGNGSLPAGLHCSVFRCHRSRIMLLIVLIHDSPIVARGRTRNETAGNRSRVKLFSRVLLCGRWSGNRLVVRAAKVTTAAARLPFRSSRSFSYSCAVLTSLAPANPPVCQMSRGSRPPLIESSTGVCCSRYRTRAWYVVECYRGSRMAPRRRR